MPRRPPLPVLLLAMVSLATPALAPAEAPTPDRGGEVAGHVVVLDPAVDDVAGTAADLLAPLGRAPVFVYEHALKGFSVQLDAAQAATLARAPGVEFVEQDRTFTVAGTSTSGLAVPTGVARVGAAVGSGRGTVVDADVAVLDTGVDAAHPDLNVHRLVDCTEPVPAASSSSWIPRLLVPSSSGRDREVCAPDQGADESGHGTHVAGVIGARDDGRGVVGVAPGVRLWAIKVLDPVEGGSTSHIVAGLDHAAEHARELEVVNLSFAARGRSESTDRAIEGATRAGLVVVAAAGNAGEPASWFTPANAPTTITVSAITDLDGRPGGRGDGTCRGADDRFATYSNYGRRVTIAAPGSCILSTAIGGGTARYSGTSVAAPHVAGAAARHIASSGEPRTSKRWARTRDVLLSRATPQSGPCGFAGGRSGEPLLRLSAC